MLLARFLLILGCVVLVDSAAPRALTASAHVSGPGYSTGVAQVPFPVVPGHRHGFGPVPVPVPVPVPLPVLAPVVPPPPPPLAPPVLLPPPPRAAGFPAVPIIPEADSLPLLVGGLVVLGAL